MSVFKKPKWKQNDKTEIAFHVTKTLKVLYYLIFDHSHSNLLQISTYESYNLKCPSQASWKIRANVKCNSILIYTCLFNNVEKKYVEGCRGPDWDRKGTVYNLV